MGVDEETASLLRTEAAPEPRRGRSASVAACVAAVGVVREPPARDPLPHPPPTPRSGCETRRGGGNRRDETTASLPSPPPLDRTPLPRSVSDPRPPTSSPPRSPRQVAAIAVLAGPRVAPAALPALGWSVEESWDTHAWQAGDWWRPAPRPSRAAAEDAVPAGSLGAAERPVAPVVAAADAPPTTPRVIHGGDQSDDEDDPGSAPASVTSVASLASSGSSSTDPGGPWKIVAFASHNYLGIATAWYDRLSALGYTEHVVAAMDERLFDVLASRGYRVEDHVVSPSEKPEPGEPVPGWGRHLWKLWRYRLSYVLRQTQLGRNVFLVDVDTMWNRYVPLEALFDGSADDRASDVFFSQGTVYPPDAFDAWGFVNCMGSVGFRATPGAQTLLRQALASCAEGSCDDQVAMNRALLRKYGVEWDRERGVGEGVLGRGTGAGAGRSDSDNDSDSEEEASRAKKSEPRANGEESAASSSAAAAASSSPSSPPVRVHEPSVRVRVWPKPFAFRSFMKDVEKTEAAALGGVDGPEGYCLGQVNGGREPPAGSSNAGSNAGSNSKAVGSVITGEGEEEDEGVDFSVPFIVAPCLAKDGAQKVEAWNKFQRFCYVIKTPAFRKTALPRPGEGGRGASLPAAPSEAR